MFLSRTKKSAPKAILERHWEVKAINCCDLLLPEESKKAFFEFLELFQKKTVFKE